MQLVDLQTGFDLREFEEPIKSKQHHLMNHREKKTRDQCSKENIESPLCFDQLVRLPHYECVTPESCSNLVLGLERASPIPMTTDTI